VSDAGQQSEPREPETPMVEFELLTFTVGWKGHDHKKIKETQRSDRDRHGARTAAADPVTPPA
jgi:hypothetical protein